MVALTFSINSMRRKVKSKCVYMMPSSLLHYTQCTKCYLLSSAAVFRPQLFITIAFKPTADKCSACILPSNDGKIAELNILHVSKCATAKHENDQRATRNAFQLQKMRIHHWRQPLIHPFVCQHLSIIFTGCSVSYLLRQNIQLLFIYSKYNCVRTFEF